MTTLLFSILWALFFLSLALFRIRLLNYYGLAFSILLLDQQIAEMILSPFQNSFAILSNVFVTLGYTASLTYFYCFIKLNEKSNEDENTD